MTKTVTFYFVRKREKSEANLEKMLSVKSRLLVSAKSRILLIFCVVLFMFEIAVIKISKIRMLNYREISYRCIVKSWSKQKIKENMIGKKTDYDNWTLGQRERIPSLFSSSAITLYIRIVIPMLFTRNGSESM